MKETKDGGQPSEKGKAPSNVSDPEALKQLEKKKQVELQEEEDLEIKKQEEIEKEKRELRKANLNAASNRPTAAFLKSLDSSIKRNTSFIKKLRQLSEDQKDSILKELNLLNLSRYISEVVTSIVEAKIKVSDVGAAVKICSLLHQRYADFTPQLIPALVKLFPPKQVAILESDQERNSKLAKKRVVLRLLGELFACGLFSDSDILLRILQDLIHTDQAKDKDGGYLNLSLIVSFTRTVGDEILHLKQKGGEGEEKEKYLTPEHHKQFIDLLESYFESVSNYLIQEHKQLRAKEKENHHILNTKGELPEANITAYDKLRKSYEKVMTNLTVLASLLNKNMPELPEDTHTTRIESTIVIGNSLVKESSQTTTDSIFDDEDTRSFYENLPDLRALVPGVLFGDSETKKDKKSEASETKKEEGEEEKLDEKEKEERERQEREARRLEREKEEKEEKEEAEKSDAAPPGGSSLDALLARLPNCVNRDLIHQASLDFCYINSKTNRKKLVKALFNVPRTNLALIPYYSRMVAILNQVMKDIGPLLVSLLEEEFNDLYQKKNQINIETKIRNIRFLGELTKFRICPTSLVLSCLKQCLDDFVHHNVDVACNLLETCGRFLYRSPETHVRTKNLLDKMMRLKNAQNLHPRLDNMVENAYYLCVPPEGPTREKKQEEPLKLYIKKLIYTDLNKNTTKPVLKQLRKVPWDKYENFIIDCLLKVHKGKFNQIDLVASLISGLAAYHEFMGIKLVDQLLEMIRLGLENHDFSKQQRLIMLIKLLGELYNYYMIESQIVFDMLYTLITFSSTDGSIDPPHDCFHIRLVCTLLDTCGQYFDRGTPKKKLDRFLVYFQRYIFTKSSIPMDVDFMISDCFESLRPDLIRYSSLSEAMEAIAQMEQEDLQLPYQSTSGASQVEGEQTHHETESDGTEDSDEEESEEEELNEEEDEEPHEEEEEEEAREEEEEEEEVLFRANPHKSVQEDEDFDREFKRLMQESLESRKLEMKQGQRGDMSIPMNLLRSSGTRSSMRVEDEPTNEGIGENALQFRLLMKKGNKQTTKSLNIPLTASIAINSKHKQSAEKEEQKELKRFVLEYEEREDEESINEPVEGASTGKTSNKSRGGKTSQKNKRGISIFHSGGQHFNRK